MAVRVTEIVMHREPRGAESAEITLGEVRLSVLGESGEDKSARGTGAFAPFKYPRTYSALRSNEGVFFRKSFLKKPPKRSGTAF